jgi:hypothetical protein
VLCLRGFQSSFLKPGPIDSKTMSVRGLDGIVIAHSSITLLLTPFMSHQLHHIAPWTTTSTSLLVSEQHAGGLHDAAVAINLAVVPRLNWPSSFATWLIASTRALVAALVAAWVFSEGFPIGTFDPEVRTHGADCLSWRRGHPAQARSGRSYQDITPFDGTRYLER